MKKRILFVDDEPLVLQGIQRMLRGMREQWDMDFADGGAKAKEQLAVADYDVVVTDMMMPGVNGADVLDHARLHSPRTVRLVLSGHAEQNLAVQCVGVAHQYLSKPCDAETLKQTVTRLTDPDYRNSVMMDKKATRMLVFRSSPTQPSQSYLADGQGQRIAFVGHVKQLDSGHLGKAFGGNARRGPAAAEGIFARAGLC